MGVENNKVVIATTRDDKYVEKIKEWISGLNSGMDELFIFIPGLVNGKTTIVLGPDGSKKCWELSDIGESLRGTFIALLMSFDYEDGSNPFDWVEVGYGEFGQKILRGNCQNSHDDNDYTESS